MIRLFRLLLAITVSSYINLFVYFLRRVPLIGRWVPEQLYARTGMKQKATFLVMVFGVIWALLKQFAYVGLLVYWPVVTVSSEPSEILPYFMTILLVFSFLSAPVWNARVMETKRSKYVAVKLIRIPSSVYMKVTLTQRYTLFFISFLAALLLFVPLAGGTLWDGLLAAFALTAWRGFAEYMHLLLFDRTGVILIKNNAVIWLVLLGCSALAYVPLLLEWPFAYGNILLSVPFVLLTVALGVFSAIKLARYPRYTRAVDATVKRDDPLLHLNQMIADAKKADVENRDKDYTSVENETGGAEPATSSQRKGYALLDSLFYKRHRRLLRKPLFIRLAILGGVGIAGCIALAFIGSPEELTLALLMPFLPFALYMLAIGERFCRVLFYNCDRPLMRYSFYRHGVEKHFSLRLLRLGGMNLLVGATLAAILTLMAVIGGWSISLSELLPLWLTSLALSLFLSIHHLLLYYLLQPYTSEMNAKNPLFRIFYMGLGFLCWVTLFFRPQPEMIAGVSLILTSLYLITAFILIPRYGVRTFKLK